MYKINSFKNAKEFQGLFGISNGTRRNKILLALLKSKEVWRWCREHGNYDLLGISSMAELKQVVTNKIIEAGRNENLAYEVVLGKYVYYSGIYETDSYRGVPEDGTIGFVRYYNHERQDVFKKKAGRFYTQLIEETSIGKVLPQQVKVFLAEEFCMDWQVYVQGSLPEYTLHVDDNFEKIYSREACEGDFHSCMTGRGLSSFYSDAVKAKAAYLTNKNGKVIARAVIYTAAKDEDGKVWRLCERQYSSDSNEILKRALVDSLIQDNQIDGYKFVGADCGNSRGFVDNEGNSLNCKRFTISCDLDWGDYLSYQDSFKWYNMDDNIAYNYSDCDYQYRLDTTNGEIEDEESAYDEYHDRDVADTVTVYYHGSEMSCDSEDLDDFEDYDGDWIHYEDILDCPYCSGRFLDPEYYPRDEHSHSDLLNQDFCCDDCKNQAELEFKKTNWFYCDFDKEFFENADELTTYHAWNKEQSVYEEKTIRKNVVDLYVDCEILHKHGNEIYDQINEQTKLPFGFEAEQEQEVEEEALIAV